MTGFIHWIFSCPLELQFIAMNTRWRKKAKNRTLYAVLLRTDGLQIRAVGQMSEPTDDVLRTARTQRRPSSLETHSTTWAVSYIKKSPTQRSVCGTACAFWLNHTCYIIYVWLYVHNMYFLLQEVSLSKQWKKKDVVWLCSLGTWDLFISLLNSHYCWKNPLTSKDIHKKKEGGKKANTTYLTALVTKHCTLIQVQFQWQYFYLYGV